MVPISRAHKKAEKKARSQESKSTGSNVSNPLTTATGHMQGHPTSAPSLTRPQMQEQVPSQLVPPLMIGQRLQQLAMSADGVTASPCQEEHCPQHTQEEKEWTKIELTLWQAPLTPSLPQP